MQWTSREEFDRLSQPGHTVPVVSDLLADLETPLSAYWKLSQGRPHTFLLESVTGGEQLARYSVIGFEPVATLRAKNETVWIQRGDRSETRTLSDGQDPLHVAKELMPDPPVEIPGLPKFLGGAVGHLAYDFVRYLEVLPDSNPDDLGVADVFLFICRKVVIFDHARNLIRIIVLADPDGYADAVAEIEDARARLAAPLPALPATPTHVGEVESNMTQADFEAAVCRMREYIVAGDGIQMVPSQRFRVSTNADPLHLYRSLRSLNPSPYMFLFRFGDYDLVGASPELLCGLTKRTARVRPIAGTRWRGPTPEVDESLAAELLADEKERAEHIMLVDLGRNDLGRVCEYGSVKVRELMVIERYSHVMHIVSDVVGTLRPELDQFDLVRATFPAGTVSGAPKIRAMEIIDELEPSRRGIYAGAVGYFAANGDMDTAIALRSILLKDGHAYVQAGAGIVFDSDPTKEYEETCNKAKAPLQAILQVKG